jgi:preprotein translocase subunit SecB
LVRPPASRTLQPEDAPLELAQLGYAWLAGVSFVERVPFEAGRGFEYGVNLDHSIVESDDEKSSVYRMTLTVEWTELPENSEAPFDLTLDVAGVFHWQDMPVDADFRRAWLELNASYLLWPYARAYAALITGASTLPPLTLYTMRVPQVPLRDVKQPHPKEAAAGNTPRKKPRGAPPSA